MRNLTCALLAGMLAASVGCNEFVAQNERAAATATDVVGEPADSTPDQPSLPEILGSNLATPAQTESSADSSDNPMSDCTR